MRFDFLFDEIMRSDTPLPSPIYSAPRLFWQAAIKISLKVWSNLHGDIMKKLINYVFFHNFAMYIIKQRCNAPKIMFSLNT